MNTQSNGMSAEISAARRLYWSVRRELWESRSIYVAPLAVAALTVVGFLISTFRLPAKMRAALPLNSMQQRAIVEQPYTFAALIIMGTTFVVAILYCLDALYGERRDRSVLFWKSLPVSDAITVLSKASIPLVVLPLLTFAITIVTQWIMLLISMAVLLAGGVSVAVLWTNLPLWQMSMMLLYHLLAVHALWYAPIFGWMLLVSGWAQRVPILWAALPPLAIGFVERIALNTSHFGAFLKSRINGGPESAAPAVPHATHTSMDWMTPFTVIQFLTSPGLWIGLAFTAVFLAAAVRQRRRQEPI